MEKMFKKIGLCEVKEGISPNAPMVKTLQSAGADIEAYFYDQNVTIFNRWNEKLSVPVVGECITLCSGDRAMIPTGWRMKIPHGYQIKVVPRSGMALKYGITLINTPGTIDSDYTDEVRILLYNASDVDYKIKHGDAVAQIELVQNTMQDIIFISCSEEEILKHKETSDRDGGFGSTGK